MLNVAVIGATGYTGMELVKILIRHPHVRISALTTRQKETRPVHDLIPSLPKDIDLEIKTYSFPEVSKKSDLVFLCLPHTEAMETAQKFRKAGKIVIDLSADFRLRSKKIYETWYGVKHTNPILLKEAVYGLPEFNRKFIQKADLISNPGCYPTGAILGIAPLLAHRLVAEDSIIIDSKSGVSGAGKKPNPATQFCEVNENFYAYKVGRHQHTPEIEQALSDVSGSDIKVTFTPHLLPVTRGILSTIYLKKKRNVKREAISDAFKDAYHEEPFVRVKPEGAFPALRDVQHTNYCDVGYLIKDDSDEIIVITAIDNLLKGASGQAVQNMNIRCGFAEEEGIR
ncbi:MAG: N-acetyl-gamma-glutamyl-phosphate reductase [Candidatus Omnitrophica bacterium]|nr:N-acetyl-gamma-glutamyl-phosphate reductase [Candidatus Omnitrophota bacterium]